MQNIYKLIFIFFKIKLKIYQKYIAKNIKRKLLKKIY